MACGVWWSKADDHNQAALSVSRSRCRLGHAIRGPGVCPHRPREFLQQTERTVITASTTPVVRLARFITALLLPDRWHQSQDALIQVLNPEAPGRSIQAHGIKTGPISNGLAPARWGSGSFQRVEVAGDGGRGVAPA
jgi:hypothetical protein